MVRKTDVEDHYKKESEMFNCTADYYDKFRPSYPQEIISTFIRETGINEHSMLLEIGAGSGKATALLADIGCEICCVDPGPALVVKGNEAFRGYPKIKFHCARFEDFNVNPGYFDVVCAFQAFHWVPQPIGYQKCAEQLKQNGRLALVWNMYITYDNDVDNELLSISAKFGGLADFLSEKQCNERIISIIKGINSSGLYGKVDVFKHQWQQSYTADEFFGFCLTGNSFVQKSDEEKKSAYDDILKLADKHNGHITRPYLSVLYLASKR